MSEIRDIPGYKGYQASKDGQVYSAWSGKRLTAQWHLLKQTKSNSGGYMTVNLGGGNLRTVHRLVLETFVGARPEGMEARHLDGNPENNALSKRMSAR